MSHFQIPIFSTLVGWLADMMAWAVQFFYNLTASLGFPSYGIAIIILTIVIKVLLLPFALKQIKSMKGMQEIQPKVAALQKKYKNDRAKLSIEMQKLYREHNISPLAGCLPFRCHSWFPFSMHCRDFSMILHMPASSGCPAWHPRTRPMCFQFCPQ